MDCIWASQMNGRYFRDGSCNGAPPALPATQRLLHQLLLIR